jgi:dihydropyrimidinase
MKGGFNGAKFVCSPPLRTADHQAELWTGLVKDDLQLVSTDHCPFDFEGQKDLGKGDFRKVPNGLPGVEDRVDLLHDGGVVAGRIGKERWVEIISTAPAKLFGMFPRKGTIAVGSDADIVVYDPAATRTISATTHHMDVDYSCYEGRTVQGRSDIVLSRGTVIVRDGAFTGRKGHGRFIRRATADYARMS